MVHTRENGIKEKGKSSHKRLALACKAKWTVTCFVTSPCCSLLTLYCFSYSLVADTSQFVNIIVACERGSKGLRYSLMVASGLSIQPPGSQS